MTPTDVTLGDNVSSALECNPYIAGRTLCFETQQGRVVLKGMVRSYFQKQMAQEAIRRLDGVQEIQNELQVCATWTLLSADCGATSP